MKLQFILTVVVISLCGVMVMGAASPITRIRIIGPFDAGSMTALVDPDTKALITDNTPIGQPLLSSIEVGAFTDGGCTTITNLTGRHYVGIQNCGTSDLWVSIADGGGVCPSLGMGLHIPSKATGAGGACGIMSMELPDTAHITAVCATTQVFDGGASITAVFQQ